MANGMLRGAGMAWLGLIALQALTTQRGSGAVGGLLGSVNGLVGRALDPKVPAIPNLYPHGKPDPNALPPRTDTVNPDGTPNGGWLNGHGQYVPPNDRTQQQPQSPSGPPSVATAYRIPWPSVPGSMNA